MRKQTHTLLFFLVFSCTSNMLVRLVASSLRPPLERTPPKLELVNIRLFTSLWLVFNCLYLLMSHRSLPKKSCLLPYACCRRDEHLLLLAPQYAYQFFFFLGGEIQFFLVFLTTTRVLAKPSGDCLLFLFIYLFIFEFHLSMSRSIILHSQRNKISKIM